MGAYNVRAAFQARNAARIQKIRAAAQILLEGYVKESEILSALDMLTRKELPFEFDLGYAVGEGGGERFEIGFNPRVSLTSEFHETAKTVFSAFGFNLEPLTAFMSSAPFYRVSPTLGAEWPKDGKEPKLTFLMEDSRRLMSAGARRKVLTRLCEFMGGGAEEIIKEFDAEDLDMLAADFNADGLKALRFFKDYAPLFAPSGLMSPDAAKKLELFESLLPPRRSGDGHIYYKKYEPHTGALTGFKVYYTPPQNAPVGFGDSVLGPIIEAYSLEGADEWKQAKRGREVCASRGLQTAPVCISAAFGKGDDGFLNFKYVAAYFAVGEIPDEFGI